MPHLLLQPPRRPRDELVGAHLVQQHRSSVRIKDSAEPLEHLRQKLVDVHPGESGIGDSEQVRQPR